MSISICDIKLQNHTSFIFSARVEDKGSEIIIHILEAPLYSERRDMEDLGRFVKIQGRIIRKDAIEMIWREGQRVMIKMRGDHLPVDAGKYSSEKIADVNADLLRKILEHA